MPGIFSKSLFASALLGICCITASAQDDPVADLRRRPGVATLAAALPLLADPATKGQVRAALREIDPYPHADLVTLLAHPELAVRLAALEILEEKSGGDYDFNPWAPAADPSNEAPLALWKKWLDDGSSDRTGGSHLLSDEQRHGYLRDLLTDDANKSTRARRMLEADGLAAVGFLETFLDGSETLPAGIRAKVREAQYQIVLSSTFGAQAPALVRQLAFGSRDQTLSALGSLKSGGLGALPVIRDFLLHPDPLVRETAIDSMLASGGSQSLAIVGPVLSQETDPNVIHGALRRIKEIPGDESLAIAISFLSREEEDLLISAIQACQKLVAGDSDSYSRSGRSGAKKVSANTTASHAAVIAVLSDPRWRVRTAALEYIAAAKVKDASKKCVELLEDPDEFVRYSAINAATALGASEGAPILRKMFFADQETVGAVLTGYAALGSTPDDEMMKKLGEYSADARIAAIRASESDEKLSFIPLRFANDTDMDVACAALRYLSSEEERVDSPQTATVLVEALRSGIPEKRAAVLEQISLPAGDPVLDADLAADLGDFAKPAESTSH